MEIDCLLQRHDTEKFLFRLFKQWTTHKSFFLFKVRIILCICIKKKTLIADFRVTAGTPFYSWIYILQSHDLDTQKAFNTSGTNDQLKNLMYNGVKSPFAKIICRLDILFKPNPIIIGSTWYDCVISSHGSIIFTRNRERLGGGVKGQRG